MNSTTNLGVIIDIKLNSGGALHMTHSHIFFLKKLKKAKKKLKISLIVTDQQLYLYLKKKYNLPVVLYKKDYFFNKLLNYVYKKIGKYFSLNSHFENFLEQKKINLIYFSSPSYLVLLFKNLRFIYTVFDLIDKKLEDLEEHNKSTVNIRDKSYKHASLYAKKISITNDQRKKLFIRRYKCAKRKIFTIQFPPSICINKIKPKKVKIKFSDNKINSYMFYPAQYWSHKNHSYIIKSLNQFKSSKLKNVGCIFTGHDKGHLDYLKKLAVEAGVEKKIIFFNYLSNSELVYLYKKCLCVVFPSLIGFDSIPMYESFYFKKIIIFNQKTIDNYFNKNIVPLNVNKHNDLGRKILSIKNNDKLYKKIIKNNSVFFKKKFQKLENYYSDLLFN